MPFNVAQTKTTVVVAVVGFLKPGSQAI